MKKKIIIFILILSMMIQNLEIAAWASNPVNTEDTIPEGIDQTDETDPVPEDGDNDLADTEDAIPGSENDDPADSEDTIPDDENVNLTDAEDAVPEDGDRTHAGNADAADSEQSADDSEMPDTDTESTATSSDPTTDINDEAIGTSVYVEPEATEQYTRKMQYAQSDIAALSAGSETIKDSQGLYFGYIVENASDRTGILSAYLSESGNIVIPHKLDNHYMVGIGESAFANMNQTDSSDLTKLPSQSTSGKTLLSSGEQKILESVNAARIKEGKIPLVMSSTLRETARCKTLDMLNKNYFDHKNTDGTYTSHWLTNCGYPISTSWWAENIAYNYVSAEYLYTQWWNSPGHKANMMNEHLRAIGIGVYQGNNGKIMGTQVFSSVIFQNLTKVKIEYGYESIGSRAFYGCSNLASITIPSTVTEIADNAFDGCNVLTIRGKSGSYAQAFAVAKKIPFQAIEEVCPIKTFGYEQENVFLEVGDMDSIQLIMEPADYRHLIREDLPEGQQIVRFLEDGAILALENGNITLRASAADLTGECRITVGERTAPLREIRFYEDEIVLYEGENTKLFYRVSPIDTTESVHLTSSDDQVFVVENGEDVRITAVHAGTAVLTASNDDGSVSAKITVKVLTENESLVLPDDLKAMTNVTGTLAGVSLAKYPGFSWKEPQTVLMAKKDEPVQYFAAQYSDGDKILQDCILPVSVSSASGLTVSMENKALTSGKLLSLSEIYELNIELNVVGAAADSSFYDVNCSIDQTGIARIEKLNDNNWRITPQSAGKCSVTVEIKLKDTSGSYGPAAKPYGTYQKIYSLQIEDKTYVKKIRVVPEPEMSAGVYQLEDGSLVAEEGVTKFYVRAHADDETGQADTVAGTQFSFGTDRSGVLQVKSVTGEDGLAQVTIKKAGNSVITVTAKDNGKRTESVPVYVQNLSPQLKNKSLTLNRLKPQTTAMIDLQESEINPIQSVELYEDKALQTKSALFTIQKDNSSGSYAAGFQNRNPEQATKSSYKLYLKVNTQAGKEYAYPITVKLTDKKPSVTLKQSAKINLFYQDADALLAISGGTEKVKRIEQINEPKNVPHFKVDLKQNDDSWTGTIYPADVTAQNYKKINKTVELRFTFEDYGEDFYIVKKLTVQNSYQKAALATAPSNGIVYLKTGDKRLVFQMMDKTTKNILIPGGEGNVTVTPNDDMDAKAKLTTVNGDPNISVQLLGEKGQTIKTMVSHDNWREPVSCSFKITVNRKVPSLALEKTKITLNSTAAGQETFTLKASANNNESISIVRLKEADIVGNNAAARKLLEAGKVSICPLKQGETRSLTIRLNDTSVTNGTYKYKIYGWCMQGETKIMRMNPVTLSITVTNKRPAVSLKTKGKLKLSDPENSVITYTPKLSNISGEIRTAALSGAYASAFRLIPCGDGTYQVKLRRSELTGGTYRLNLIFTLNNGIRVTSKTVTVKL